MAKSRHKRTPEDRPQTTRSRTIEIGRPEQPDLGELKTFL